MKHIHSLVLIAVALTGVFAQAEPISIACYGDGHGLSVYVDTEIKGMSAHYSKPGLDLGFISEPSSWGEQASYTTVTRNAGEIRVVTQVISGDPETIVFDSSIDLKLKWDADLNHFYVQSVELYRLGEKVQTLPFTNADVCYVP